MKKIIECVPNFSEGRDKAKIDEIVKAIEQGGDVRVLDVDPGEATNRTVVTFVGEPEAVCDAAIAGMRKAAELIDMRTHHGAHPRMGATDVLLEQDSLLNTIYWSGKPHSARMPLEAKREAILRRLPAGEGGLP